MNARVLDVDRASAGARLDRWLAAAVPEQSRAKIQALIDEGHVRVNGVAAKASYRLRAGDRVEIAILPPAPETLEPESIALPVVHEDDHVLVIDKPAGMVVHPGAGHARGTLAAAALAHAPAVAGVGGPRRPGIVHRLDKDTSGLLVMAKSQTAYDSLTAQLVARTARRVYLSIVHGRLTAPEGVVDQPIGRDPRDRTRMAVRPPGQGRRAVTRWQVVERFPQFTLVEARLETGRTHQIRVHFAALGHPVAGDTVYGGRRRTVPVALDGLALHAAGLGFVHPVTQERVEYSSPLPPRLERLLSHLRHEASAETRPAGHTPRRK